MAPPAYRTCNWGLDTAGCWGGAGGTTVVTWVHECLLGPCYSSHPVAHKKEGCLCLLRVPESVTSSQDPGLSRTVPQGASGQQVGRGLSREHGPPPSLRSLLESLTLPLGGGELERQGWGQGQGCFGENGSSEILPKGPEDHLLSFCQTGKRCSQLAPLGASSYPEEAIAQTGWQAGWCLTGKNF